ncbi:SRPBCC family protein [Streptomyces sp. NBC_01465]|uniref:SRPBCC family protein n=1 Tax=Streptomyces sp. NBC_01465 TaxID=2903878 RepID=UPI002E35B466|nr:SRPBCC family protein [Streptomyces sp. NBC_01465]
MPTEEFTRAVGVASVPEKVLEHLVRPESYIGLSPLVVAVRDVVVRDDAAQYVAVEQFRLGPLRWANPIRVAMTWSQQDRRIVSEVHSPGRVHLTATVVLTEEGAGTRVSETIRVTFPRPLRAVVVGQASKVQRHRLDELARRMA